MNGFWTAVITLIGALVAALFAFLSGRRQAAATVEAKVIEGETQVKVAQVSAETAFTQNLYTMVQFLQKRVSELETAAVTETQRHFEEATKNLELAGQVVTLRRDVDRLNAEAKRKQQEYEAEMIVTHDENVKLKDRLALLEIELKTVKDEHREAAMERGKA